MINRPTEFEALRNIKWSDIERVSVVSGLDFHEIDWKYVLMVKHINVRLGNFAGEMVMQFINPDIQLVVASRLNESARYTSLVMDELFEKLMRREICGLQAIPHCTPYDEILKHRQLLKLISERHNVPKSGQIIDNTLKDVKIGLEIM